MTSRCWDISSELLSPVAHPYSTLWSGSLSSTNDNGPLWKRFIVIFFYKVERRYTVKMCHCLFSAINAYGCVGVYVYVCVLHIHWSNSRPTAAEVVISAYQCMLPVIQRLLVSWRRKAYLTSKRRDRQQPEPRPGCCKTVKPVKGSAQN